MILLLIFGHPAHIPNQSNMASCNGAMRFYGTALRVGGDWPQWRHRRDTKPARIVENSFGDHTFSNGVPFGSLDLLNRRCTDTLCRPFIGVWLRSGCHKSYGRLSGINPP